jgi:hypothetical protein
MIKFVLYTILITLVSCRASKSVYKTNEGILSAVYENEKKYFDDKIQNKADYKPLIEFASKGRYELYKANKVELEKLNKFVILEGFLSSNGMFVGMLMSDTATLYYKKNGSTNWQFSPIDNNKNIEEQTGIRKDIINKIKNWDTTYIINLKQKVGSTVNDGFDFIATQVININKDVPIIETISFYEFK